MEQKGPFIAGTPGSEVDPAQVQDALYNMLKQATQSSAPVLGTLAQLQQRRIDRLNGAAQALGQELGNDHPMVLALREAAALAEQQNAKLNAQSSRLKAWPKVRSNEWCVFGSVVDAEGKPVAGATVRVYDKEHKLDDLLGETETDDNGDFSVVYHARELAATGENLPELYVMVADVKGNPVYSSRDSIHMNAGQSEYFAIRLAAQTPPVERKISDSAKTIKMSPRKKDG